MRRTASLLFVVFLLFGFLGSTAFAQEQDQAVQETNEPPNIETRLTDSPYVFRRSWGGEGSLLKFPNDMAIDSEGRLLIADRGLKRMIRVNLNDWSAEVKVLPGDDNIPLGIESVWVDDTGEIYITTRNNDGSDYFFKIDKNWSLILMQSAPDQVDLPHSIAVDSSGRIFVSARGGIKVFNNQGVLLFSFCPEGSEEGHCGYTPGDLSFDSQENVFVVDYSNDRIQKFTSEGKFILSIPAALQYGFDGIAIDSSDNLYVTSRFGNEVLVYSTDGSFIRKWGGWGDCNSCLKSPQGITIKGETVFVADAELHTVKAFNLNGEYQIDWNGKLKSSITTSFPKGMAIDEYGNSYILDGDNDRIIKTSPYGSVIKEWETPGHPIRVGVGPNAELFVLNWDYTMTIFSYNGDLLREWSSTPPGVYHSIAGMAVNSDGDVYVTDNYTQMVYKFSSTGTITASWGGEEQFINPLGIAVGNNHEVFVVVMNDHQIMVFSSEGQFIDSFGFGYLIYPEEIAIDGGGNIFVSSGFPYDQTIKVFSPSFEFLGSIGGYGLAVGNFQSITGLAISDEGNLFVSDRSNSRVSSFTPNLPTPDPYSGLVQNGSFEKSPALMEWTHGGNLPVSRSTISLNGSYAIRLGEPVAQAEQGIGEAWAYSNFYVDPNLTRPTLSFKYSMFVNDIVDYSDFFVAIQDGVGLNHLATVIRDGFRPCTPGVPPVAGQDLGWRTVTYDLSAYKGQHIRVHFSNRNLWPGSWGIWTNVDDVRVLDAGPLPIAGPYAVNLPLVNSYKCDVRANVLGEDKNLPMRNMPSTKH